MKKGSDLLLTHLNDTIEKNQGQMQGSMLILVLFLIGAVEN